MIVFSLGYSMLDWSALCTINNNYWCCLKEITEYWKVGYLLLMFLMINEMTAALHPLPSSVSPASQPKSCTLAAWGSSCMSLLTADRCLLSDLAPVFFEQWSTVDANYEILWRCEWRHKTTIRVTETACVRAKHTCGFTKCWTQINKTR